ncbi:MAG: hypothetical protein L0H96_26360 [Humibacillus sp.]|nr:hypothetical protein [Humibacillus sp.]
MSSLNAVVAWVGTFALFAVAVLVFGSVLLRLFGVAFMVVATVFLLMEANLDTADAGSYLLYGPMALVGLMMWVAGHAVHRAQRGWWKSPLAARLAARPERALRRSLQARAPRPPRAGRPHPGAGPVRI